MSQQDEWEKMILNFFKKIEESAEEYDENSEKCKTCPINFMCKAFAQPKRQSEFKIVEEEPFYGFPN